MSPFSEDLSPHQLCPVAHLMVSCLPLLNVIRRFLLSQSPRTSFSVTRDEVVGPENFLDSDSVFPYHDPSFLLVTFWTPFSWFFGIRVVSESGHFLSPSCLLLLSCFLGP